MLQRVPTFVKAADPISEYGVAAELRPRPEIRLVDADELGKETVAVLVVDRVAEAAGDMVRAVRSRGCTSVVVVATDLDDDGVLVAAEHGVRALTRRVEATPERLSHVVTSVAAGGGALPTDLLGRLMRNVARSHRQALTYGGLEPTRLTRREADVLKLLAEGLDTQQIAQRLCYSERTIKNAVHDFSVRFSLRNRTHAVAFALREGMI